MNAARAGEVIVLTGPPARAAALVKIPPRERVVPVTLKLPEGPTVLRAYVRPFGEDASEIRLRLPPGTPPGSYGGQVAVGGAELQVLVVVEQVLRLRVEPKRSAFTVAPGGRAEFTIDAANGGNMPIDIPEGVSFDLDATDGQDRALGRALRATLEPGERRVDRFFEELRESHGGEARVKIVNGSGPLQPGESRELACALEVPADVRVGHSYIGAWQVGNAGHVLVLDIAGGGANGKGAKKP